MTSQKFEMLGSKVIVSSYMYMLYQLTIFQSHIDVS